MAVSAFMEAGKKARTSIAKSSLSKLPSKLKILTNELREQLYDPTENHDVPQVINQSDIHVPLDSTSSKDADTTVEIGSDKSNESSQYVPSTGQPYVRHKKKKSRPKTADGNLSQLKRTGTQLLNQNRSTKFDHRKSSFKKQLRPRTPGSIIYTVNEDGGFEREVQDESRLNPTSDAINWFKNEK